MVTAAPAAKFDDASWLDNDFGGAPTALSEHALEGFSVPEEGLRPSLVRSLVGSVPGERLIVQMPASEARADGDVSRTAHNRRRDPPLSSRAHWRTDLTALAHAPATLV